MLTIIKMILMMMVLADMRMNVEATINSHERVTGGQLSVPHIYIKLSQQMRLVGDK